MVEGEAGGDHRDGAGDQQPGEARAGIAAAAHHPAEPGDHRPDVAPEVEQNRAQGADMHGDVDEQALVGNIHEQGDQHEMAGGADRQELRDALNDGQHR